MNKLTDKQWTEANKVVSAECPNCSEIVFKECGSFYCNHCNHFVKPNTSDQKRLFVK